MSLISDALNKLENQRRTGTQGPLPPDRGGGGGGKRPPGKFLIASVCLLIIAAFGGYIHTRMKSEEPAKRVEPMIAGIEEKVERETPSPPEAGIKVEREVEKASVKTPPPDDGRRESVVGVDDEIVPPSLADKGKDPALKGKADCGEGNGCVDRKLEANGKERSDPPKKDAGIERERKVLISKSEVERARERELHYYNDGVLSLREGDLFRASRNFLFVLEYNPENVDALCNLSVVSMGFEDYESAGLYLHEALRISPSHVRSLVNLGVLNMKVGKYGKSLDAFREAMKYDENNVEGLVNLALLYHKMGNVEKALHFGERAVRGAPENPETWYALGLIHYREGNLSRAKVAFSKFISSVDESDPRVKRVSEILVAAK